MQSKCTEHHTKQALRSVSVAIVTPVCFSRVLSWWVPYWVGAFSLGPAHPQAPWWCLRGHAVDDSLGKLFKWELSTWWLCWGCHRGEDEDRIQQRSRWRRRWLATCLLVSTHTVIGCPYCWVRPGYWDVEERLTHTCCADIRNRVHAFDDYTPHSLWVIVAS